MLTNTYTGVLMQWSVSTAALPTRRKQMHTLLLWIEPHDRLSCLGDRDNNEMQRNGVETVA